MKKQLILAVTAFALLSFLGCEASSITKSNDYKEKTVNLIEKTKTVELGESRMSLNTYFFLDEVYRLKYLAEFGESESYQEYLSIKGWETSPAIKTLEIYKRVPNGTLSGKEYIWAKYDSFSSSDVGVFEKLVNDIDYSYNPRTGRVVFLNRLQSNDIITIYLEDENGLLIKGDKTPIYDELLSDTVFSRLSLLKNDNNLSSYGDSTYHLMLRNAYYLPADPTVTMSVERVTSDGRSDKTEYGAFFAQVLGLMDENENYMFANEDIFDFEHGYMLIPPYISNTDNIAALYPFTNSRLGNVNGEKNWGDVIYDDRSIEKWTDRFAMTFRINEQTHEFVLDMDVVPGSEILRTDEATLVKDSDYLIDYKMGYVKLISEQAMNSDIIYAQYK